MNAEKQVKAYIAWGYQHPTKNTEWRLYVYEVTYIEKDLGNGIIMTSGIVKPVGAPYAEFIVKRNKSAYSITPYNGECSVIADSVLEALHSRHWKSTESMLNHHGTFDLKKIYV